MTQETAKDCKRLQHTATHYNTLQHTAHEPKEKLEVTHNVSLHRLHTSLSTNSSVQIQINPKSQFEYLPRNTEESEFLDLVDFGDVAFSVKTVTGLF
mmetsp:Transcript_5803/g.5157  ORF Transcript_5803/g.5157 Transcript_5803/m.5157 type:complete len:97 (-) Transcript_5803:248-538(-)